MPRFAKSKSLLYCALLMVVTPKCGGSSSTPSKGATEKVCEPGRQVQCACPAGQAGVQACNQEGSTYGVCECRSISDGTSGQAGVSGANAAPGGGASMTIGAGSGGQEAGGGESGGSGQAGAASAIGDDPCPDVKPLVNCSSTCLDPQECVVSKCNSSTVGRRVYYVTPSLGGVATIRTPSGPGVAGCESCSDGISAVATIVLEGDSFDPVMYEVDPPWYIAAFGAAQGNAICEESGRPCHAQTSTEPVLIATSDPNAPARNIRITTTFDFCPR